MVSGSCHGSKFEITTYFSLAVMGLRDCCTAVHGRVPGCWVLYIAGCSTSTDYAGSTTRIK